MTTKSPLIRRLGKGYCASGDGFYFHDLDLTRLLERVAAHARKPDESAPLDARNPEPAAPPRERAAE